MAALQAKADDVFLATLTRFNDEGRAVSPSKKGNYAPRIFVDDPEEGMLASPSPTLRLP